MLGELKVVSDPISAHVWMSLHNYALKEALFTAERLYAEVKSEENLYLLAACLCRMNRPKQVISLLTSTSFSLPKIRYLLSKCYFDCDELGEAEKHLVGSDASKSFIESLREFGEQACYAFLLLGDIYKFQNDFPNASKCYIECLHLNPMMWTAYENLCSIGDFIKPEDVFHLNNLSLAQFTPTFTVMGQAVATSKSCPVGVKAERDRLGSRENVNPIITCHMRKDAVSDLPMETDSQEKRMRGTNGSTQVVLSTYISPCYARTTNTDSNQVQAEDLSVCFTPTISVNAAPNQARRRTELPSFGLFSSLPQNPLFACLPVFTRLDIGSPVGVAVKGATAQSHLKLAIINQPEVNRRPSSGLLSSEIDNLRAKMILQPKRAANNSNIVIAAAETNQPRISTPSSQVQPLRSSNGGGIFGPTFIRTSLPWLHPISPTTTSTPAAAAVTTTKVPMEIAEAASECLHHHQEEEEASLLSESIVEPRTRAQKARAAACLSQRRSPRLSRAPKSASGDDQPAAAAASEGAGGVGTARRSSGGLVRVRLGSRSCATRSVGAAAADEDLDPRSAVIASYLHLLERLGRAYAFLSQHDYWAAISEIVQLPGNQLATGRILTWAARAHVDATNYAAAREIFEDYRRLEPWQLHGMDLYSTVLWYENAEEALSQLASDLLALDRAGAPEPWTVAGNYFSLQREHDTAIRFFRRAMQASPTDSYACTLLGHEYIAVENLERAASAFRHALRLDDRNYSARFGLSNVYFKQDFFGLADAHLVRALSVFPTSCLLLTHLGAVRARVGRLDEGVGSAIDCLNRAVELNPTNPMAIYHRASVLATLGRFQEAIDELERLMEITPQEAMIYFMLGHAYQQVGDSPKAMLFYSSAMALDPKGVNSNLRDIVMAAAASSTAANGNGAPSLPGMSPTPEPALPPTPTPPPPPQAAVAQQQQHRRGGGNGQASGSRSSRRSARGRHQSGGVVASAAAASRPGALFLSGTASSTTPVTTATTHSPSLAAALGATTLTAAATVAAAAEMEEEEEAVAESPSHHHHETMDMGDDDE